MAVLSRAKVLSARMKSSPATSMYQRLARPQKLVSSMMLSPWNASEQNDENAKNENMQTKNQSRGLCERDIPWRSLASMFYSFAAGAQKTRTKRLTLSA